MSAHAAALAGALCAAGLLAAGAGTASAQPAAASGIGAALAQASAASGLPRRWIAAVALVESGGEARAVSPAGALGLMQLTPATWRQWRARLGLGRDPFDAQDNLLAGAAYLRALFDRFGAPGFLAAYNAGPSRYAAHLAQGAPLPRETRAYLARLAPWIGAADAPAARRRSAPQAPLTAGLFPAELQTGRIAADLRRRVGEGHGTAADLAQDQRPGTWSGQVADLAPFSAGPRAPADGTAPQEPGR